MPAKVVIKNEIKVRTILGGFVSLFFFFVTFGFTYYHFKNYDREKNFEIYQLSASDDEQKFDITNK